MHDKGQTFLLAPSGRLRTASDIADREGKRTAAENARAHSPCGQPATAAPRGRSGPGPKKLRKRSRSPKQKKHVLNIILRWIHSESAEPRSRSGYSVRTPRERRPSRLYAAHSDGSWPLLPVGQWPPHDEHDPSKGHRGGSERGAEPAAPRQKTRTLFTLPRVAFSGRPQDRGPSDATTARTNGQRDVRMTQGSLVQTRHLPISAWMSIVPA